MKRNSELGFIIDDNLVDVIENWMIETAKRNDVDVYLCDICVGVTGLYLVCDLQIYLIRGFILRELLVTNERRL